MLQTATVTLNEKASIGTLFDLCSFCLDTIRLPPTPTVAASTTSPPLPPDSSDAMSALAQQTLEASLLLSTTQLGLFLALASTSATARREITGEIASDLAGLLDKASGRGVIEKGGKKGEVSALIQLLRLFAAEWEPDN